MGIDKLSNLNHGRRRAVFFDRDGVLNRALIRDGKPYPPLNVGQLEIVPEASAWLARLKSNGFLLLVVTNQPDVARGIQRRSEVEAINEALRASLPIDDFFTCYHDDANACECRKPKPGLLFQAQSKYGLDLPAGFLIGDRWRDIDAGANAGCTTVLIDFGYAERASRAKPTAVTKSLGEAVRWIEARFTGSHT